MSNDDFLVIASQDGRIQALDARDGAVRWTQPRGHPFAGRALARVGNQLVAVSGDGYVCMLALADGTLRWEVTLPIAAPIPTPLAGLRIAANRDLIAVQLGIRMFALARADGHTVWEDKAAPGAFRWWLLAVGSEHVYTLLVERPFIPARPPGAPVEQPPGAPGASNAPSFVTSALSTWDGTLDWAAVRETSALEPPWDGVASSLVEADGIVYLSGRQGLHALEAASGRVLWTCDTIPYHHIGALAVGHDSVTVAAGAHLGAYRRDTGTRLWSEVAETRADGYFEWFDAPLVLGDAVYVGRTISRPSGFQLECRDGESGALRWVWPAVSASVRYDIGWRYRGAGATLYVPSLDDLWAIQAADGKERWHLPYDLRSEFHAFLAVAMTDA